MAEQAQDFQAEAQNSQPQNTSLDKKDGKTGQKVAYKVKDLNGWYAKKHALINQNFEVREKEVTAFIGPSGCGKSTLLRCFNRMNDTIPAWRAEGQIKFYEEDILDPQLDLVSLRQSVGMVFQKANPFPKNIYDNIAYGPRLHGLFKTKEELDEIVKESLVKAGLWREVKDRLHHPALGLSGGQQQRLCIARAIAINPQVLLMDEPCSALDPIATGIIEELIHTLRDKYTIVIVTHSMSQAQRVSQKTAFFHLGVLVEFGKTEQIFKDPQKEKTQKYIGGAFG